ncbi:unnamed protein product [Bursaphelenchus xylophilus]|uniref:(pine wood nematode) hypothetical protein n=1 Tax=Bursaphelenchus xylophilus TaxID=6326 RepID=A0A1I7RN01_BURXY|nr:unnamed protein product [Bursaphelenchus xylophilus]CAG9125302.1 unnamed protein product [Bursaphelenchus xylophilus]
MFSIGFKSKERIGSFGIAIPCCLKNSFVDQLSLIANTLPDACLRLPSTQGYSFELMWPATEALRFLEGAPNHQLAT